MFDELGDSASLIVATVAETAARKVKLEEVEAEEEEADLEMTTSSDAAISFTTSCDLSQGDDVVSSTSDVYTCDYEGLFVSVVRLSTCISMVALWNRADHYIFAL